MALQVAVLVLGLWYPLRSPRWPGLSRYIGAIVLVQLLAFGYGVFSIAQARPVHLGFEVDRFRVDSAADIDPAQLPRPHPACASCPGAAPR